MTTPLIVSEAISARHDFELSSSNSIQVESLHPDSARQSAHPQQRPRYSRDQKFIDAAADVMGSAPGAEDRVFGAKCLVSASLPYRKPRPDQLIDGAWIRKNGDYTLWIQGAPTLGLPYGAYPRLFVIWLTSEAIRTGGRHISTGRNFAEFCRKLHVDSSRGKNGAGKRMIDQAERLLASRAGFVTGNLDTSKVATTELLQFADDFTLFFDDSGDDRQGSLFRSEIVITQKFFDEITAHCIPIDLRAVLPLQQAPLELDIYQWLAYRMFALKTTSRPTWLQLCSQFGSNYGRMIDFKTNFLAALKRVKDVYPKANVDYNDQGLVLHPSPTPVPPRHN